MKTTELRLLGMIVQVAQDSVSLLVTIRDHLRWVLTMDAVDISSHKILVLWTHQSTSAGVWQPLTPQYRTDVVKSSQQFLGAVSINLVPVDVAEL